MTELNFEEFWVGVPHEMVEEGVLTNEAVAMYYYIGETVNNKWYSVTTLALLLEGLQLTNVDRYYSVYKEALKELVTHGYITIYNKDYDVMDIDTIKKNDRLIIAVEQLENNYVQGNVCDIKYMMEFAKENNIKNRTAFLRYYLLIQKWTSFEDGERIGYFTSKQASLACGVDARQFKIFNEALKDLGIFYYNNDYITPVRGLNTSTYFARTTAMQESSFNIAVEQMAESQGWIKLNKEETNKKRSEAMKKYHEEKKEKKALKEVEEEVVIKTTSSTENPKLSSVTVMTRAGKIYNVNLVKERAMGTISEEAYKKYEEEYKKQGFIYENDDTMLFMTHIE